MGLVHGSNGKKDLNVELNLLPVFDILSVCICFLLMTVVWIEIRSLETKQAIGGQAMPETEQRPSVWFSIDEKNNITVTFKSPKNGETTSTWHSRNGQIDWSRASIFLKLATSKKIENAMILPTKTTKYDQVIRLMDMLKQDGIIDIGLSPI